MCSTGECAYGVNGNDISSTILLFSVLFLDENNIGVSCIHQSRPKRKKKKLNECFMFDFEIEETHTNSFLYIRLFPPDSFMKRNTITA